MAAAEEEKQQPAVEGLATSAEAPAAAAEEPKKKKPKWLPLESNPEVINSFLERVGAAGAWRCADVIGLDDELLQFVPHPVGAVFLLFPSKGLSKPRRQELRERTDKAPKAPTDTFYLIQHSEFGNACGTIAAVHAIGNLARSGQASLTPGSPLAKFLDESAKMNPDEAGRALAAADALHEASEAAAKSEKAQTKTPGRDESVDGHFIVFVSVGGRLVELDGCMGFPVDHGATSTGTFLKDAAKVIREDFMSRAPGNPNFSVMALGPAGGGDSPEDLLGALGPASGVPPRPANPEDIATLAALGFGPEEAQQALEATGGNVEAAANLLCG